MYYLLLAVLVILTAFSGLDTVVGVIGVYETIKRILQGSSYQEWRGAFWVDTVPLAATAIVFAPLTYVFGVAAIAVVKCYL